MARNYREPLDPTSFSCRITKTTTTSLRRTPDRTTAPKVSGSLGRRRPSQRHRVLKTLSGSRLGRSLASCLHG